MTQQKTFFVTGTDTDVGKTLCCKALLQAANKQNIKTAAYKPIAAGCRRTESGLRNDDALTLLENSSLKLLYQLVNPIAFEPAIAPHIAAQLENNPINVNLITQGLQHLQQTKAEILIVEGAGGWRLPLNNQQMFSDWVIEHKLPVILVVGIKLGCLNHALLTYETILKDGLTVVGWIANQLQPDIPYYQENKQLLMEQIAAPMIAELPYLASVNDSELIQYVNCDLTKLI
jgi:dethiobiotin synthetase